MSAISLYAYRYIIDSGMLHVITDLLQKCMNSVELVSLCMFQTNLLLGNCSRQPIN